MSNHAQLTVLFLLGPNGALALRLVDQELKPDQEKSELQECTEVFLAHQLLRADHAMLIHAQLTVLFPAGLNGVSVIEHAMEVNLSEPELLSHHHSEEDHAQSCLKKLNATLNHAQWTVLLVHGTHGPLVH